MTNLDPSEAVGRRMFVAAETSLLAHIYGFGRVISYTDAPTYVIEKPDGTRFSWQADLCRAASEAELMELLHGVLDGVYDEAPP